jgi:hypothetical protein
MRASQDTDPISYVAESGLPVWVVDDDWAKARVLDPLARLKPWSSGAKSERAAEKCQTRIGSRAIRKRDTLTPER